MRRGHFPHIFEIPDPDLPIHYTTYGATMTVKGRLLLAPLIMVALCNRETIYIFMLWFVMAALCNMGAIIFLPCDFYLSIYLSFFSFLA